MSGTPPRRRGALDLEDVDFGAERTTPAWAGSTVWLLSGLGTFADHPRVGGEHQLREHGPFAPIEAPPRRRGDRGPM
ncbi:hypothetical protein ACWD1Z_32810 [Streptomyces sp. NPDC002784]